MNPLRKFDAWLWSDAGGGVASAWLLLAIAIEMVIALVTLVVAPLVVR